MARAGSQRREENEVEFARIVAFSDGVFAIAITLLVLGLSVPEHLHGQDLTTVLWDQRQDLFAYGLSFAVIGRFWLNHHRFFSEVTGFDGRLLGLNLFYLAWIGLIPFSSSVLGDHGSASAAVILYAANLAGVMLVGVLLVTDARRAGLAKPETAQTAEFRRRSLVVAVVFLVSIPIAFVSVGLAEIVWTYLFLEPLIRRRVVGRRKRGTDPGARR
jgi:uncharacterized membrane protein